VETISSAKRGETETQGRGKVQGGKIRLKENVLVLGSGGPAGTCDAGSGSKAYSPHRREGKGLATEEPPVQSEATKTPPGGSQASAASPPTAIGPPTEVQEKTPRFLFTVAEQKSPCRWGSRKCAFPGDRKGGGQISHTKEADEKRGEAPSRQGPVYKEKRKKRRGEKEARVVVPFSKRRSANASWERGFLPLEKVPKSAFGRKENLGGGGGGRSALWGAGSFGSVNLGTNSSLGAIPHRRVRKILEKAPPTTCVFRFNLESNKLCPWEGHA